MMFRKTFLVVAALVVTSATLTFADDCKPVNGHLKSEGFAGPTCPSPVGLCTAGRLNGGIQGDFVFVAQELIPSDTPGVFFYTGEIVVTADKGTLTCRDAGAFSFATGAVVDLCTILSGTGRYSGASGDIKIFGTFAENVGDSDYRGQLCRP